MNEARLAHIDNGKGYAVPVTWVAGGGPVFLVMGALGVAAPFYDKLVAELAARGWSVALMEQRGLGSSALRPSRRHNWGFRDVVEDDVPAVLDWIAKEAPRQPVYLFGHSLGGHYAAMCAGLYPQRFEGIVMCLRQPLDHRLSGSGPPPGATAHPPDSVVPLAVWLLPR